MCGISGLHQKVKQPGVIAQAILANMNEKLAHRGPDGSGLKWFEDQHFGIAHRRLSIIDLSAAAAQPMQIEDRYWLTFNGEIYNYLELKIRLEQCGAQFKSASDAEVLLQAYHHWGAAFLKELNGMWAFAIYDTQENLLFCARDRYGVKPFYYSDSDAYFAFASEIKALLEVPNQARIANKEALHTFFAHGLIETKQEGFFKGIYELMPGHALCYRTDLQQKSIYCYEDYAGSPPQRAQQELAFALKNAVSLRLRADVPIGFCLSGGLDSSSILHLANEIKNERQIGSLQHGLHAFTAAHQSEQDERSWAEQMVKATAAQWHISELDSLQLTESVQEIIYHQDIPLLSTSTFAQSSVMKCAAANNIKILIDGQGGDELFAGYQVFYPTFFKELFWTGKWWLFHKEWSALDNSPTSKKYIFKEWLKDVISYLPSSIRNRIEKKQKNETWQYLTNKSKTKRKRQQTLQGHLADFCRGHQLKGLLRWEDRCAMQYSIESRTPFADDVALIRIARSLPSKDLIQNGWSKFALRNALDNQLPKAISWRKDKKGFSVPESQWLMQSAAFWINTIKEKAHLDKSELIDKDKLQKDLFDIFKNPERSSGQNFAFRYACYLFWLEAFQIESFG